MSIPKHSLFLALLIFASCTRKTAVTSNVLIGEFEAMTGSESAYGVETHKGVQLAIEEANQKGGIRGLPIELITYDDEGKADAAVTVITRLITSDKVHAIIGEVASTRTISAGRIAQQLKVPMVSPSSTSPQVTEIGDYIFRVCFTDPFQGLVMAKFATENLGKYKAAILRDTKSDYSLGLSEHFAKEFSLRGGKVVADLQYSSGDVDFRSQLVAIRNSQAEVLFIPGYYTEVGLIARQARELKYEGILLGGDGWDSDKLTEIGGNGIIGGYFANHYFGGDPSPVVQSFVSRYRERFKEMPGSSAVMGYDAALAVLSAVRRAPTLDRASIKKALAETTDLDAVSGKITFDAARNALKKAVVLKVADRKNFEFASSVLP